MDNANWQHISTAPTSTRVLVAFSHGHVLIAVHGEYRGWMRDDGSDIFDALAYWQPIPEAPTNG